MGRELSPPLQGAGSYGYNAASGEYGDMIAMGGGHGGGGMGGMDF